VNRREVQRIEGGRRVKGFSKERPPVISIITAVFNSHTTIEQTIRSVITQNYPHREYIVIDGGSTDGTVDILREFDNSIDYWVSEADNGVYDALNKGIDLAQGEWIYFLGSDDRLVNERVLEDVFSKSYESKMIYGNVLLGDSGLWYDGKFSKHKLLRYNICQQAIFYHRDILRSLGKFEVRYTLLADWVLNMRIFSSHSAMPIFINNIIAYYATSGLSSIDKDDTFNKERSTLVRNIFGIHYYLLFKFLLAKDKLKECCWKNLKKLFVCC